MHHQDRNIHNQGFTCAGGLIKPAKVELSWISRLVRFIFGD